MSLAGHYSVVNKEGVSSPYWISKEEAAGDLNAALDKKVQEYVTGLGGSKFIRKVRLCCTDHLLPPGPFARSPALGTRRPLQRSS